MLEKTMNIMFNKILHNLFLFITLLKFSIAADSLFPNQTIGIEQTLVSQNGAFEMGFFSPGKSQNLYLGIRYKQTPDVVVWVANPKNPITDSQGVTFSISKNGNLAITKGESIIWSENLSSPASNPVLRLLDTGNLVLVDNQSSAKPSYWQSFDYPTDTWLPGMKMVDDVAAGVEKYLTSWKSSDDPSPGDFTFRIENQGLPELVILNGTTKKTYRTGKWNGVDFNGFPPFPDAIIKADLRFRGEKLISMSRPYDSSIFIRSTLDSSGYVRRYTMNARRDSWNPVFAFPTDQCDSYGYCGAYGICRVDQLEKCKCLKGFAPKSKNDWNLQDYSGGCARNTPLSCHSGDDFQVVGGVKYPDMLKFWMNTSMSLDECRVECLQNCNCTAYANTYRTNGGSGCVMWFGELIDMRELAVGDSKGSIYLRLAISELEQTTNLENLEKKKRGPVRLILVIFASVAFLSGSIGGGIILMTRRKRQASKNNNVDLELPIFSLETIMAATNNFSGENMIGEGGFGLVYKGRLSANEEIAVKRLSKTSRQGNQEFKNEVTLIAKLQHTNLVRLLGCCIEGKETILIYEYLQNKSLDCFVFENRRAFLTWSKRFDIIMGNTRGLLYLHHDSRLKIIHRDLKTSNILLDANFNPKISDFGLARMFEDDQPIAKTRRVVGTYGYMAPEYAVDGKFSVKSDIFSFGVLLLEIVSGKKNRDFDHYDHHHNLLGHAWLLWKKGRILELMDECMSHAFIESQVKRCIHVGLLCVQKFPEDRPIMPSVLFMLGTDGAVLPEPKEPGFFMERSLGSAGRKFPFMETQNQIITITDLDGR